MKSQNTIKCDLCDKLFSSESYLKGHVTRIHTAFKESSPGPKTCTKCNKKFTTERNLKGHMVVCGLATKSKTKEIGTKRKQQSESLDQLQEKTDSERNKKQEYIKCTICNLIFNNNLELSKHTANEHNKKPRTCYYNQISRYPAFVMMLALILSLHFMPRLKK